LFNTGTVSWLYRCLVEGLFGLRGDKHGLVIQPQLPNHWSRVKVTREFRGATFEVEMRRESGISKAFVVVDGEELQVNRVTNIQAGKKYKVEVRIPTPESPR
jgi:cellobionic acid phosphorylase